MLDDVSFAIGVQIGRIECVDVLHQHRAGREVTRHREKGEAIRWREFLKFGDRKRLVVVEGHAQLLVPLTVGGFVVQQDRI